MPGPHTFCYNYFDEAKIYCKTFLVNEGFLYKPNFNKQTLEITLDNLGSNYQYKRNGIRTLAHRELFYDFIFPTAFGIAAGMVIGLLYLLFK